MSCCDKIIEAASMVTPCECESTGFCHRRNQTMVRHFQHLCKTRIEYFQEFEKGTGPGQTGGKPIRILGLGDVAAFLIQVITFGKVAMCSECQARKARLNRVRFWPISWGRHAP